MPNTQNLGAKGEELAVQHYKKLGFEVVERNYRYSRGEIDLIVLKKQLLVFVEVKFRSNIRFGYPEDFVSDKQREMIVTVADDYIQAIKWKWNIRFDIIAIDSKLNIEQFEDAFH